MRRPTTIVLMLMGGGLVLWSTTRGPSRACLDARAQQLANAEAICSTSSRSSSHGGSYGYHSGGSSSGTAMAASVARGGFGASGHAAAAGS